MVVDLSKVGKIYFTGIKGVGMAALACCAQDRGILVTGSDTQERFVTDSLLKKRNISWQVGFDKTRIDSNIDLLVYTAAHGGRKNVEVKEALRLGIPVLSYAQTLGLFMKGKRGLAVCGVGGKSTISAMLAHIFVKAGLEISYVVGVGEIFPIGSPGKFDERGELFVAEADEYISSKDDPVPKFMHLSPELIVVTNIEHDHPDVYLTLKDTLEAYALFFAKVGDRGAVVVNWDSRNVRQALEGFGGRIIKYGRRSDADWRLTELNFNKGWTDYTFVHRGKEYKGKLLIPGRFNVLNSISALAAVEYFGLSVEQGLQFLSTFRGTKRRFELIADYGDIVLYDDYAHHPLEIKSTLEALRQWYPERRVVCIFQPHTYSRTKALLSQFASSFTDADIVIVLPIYASAREKPDLTISSKLLAERIKAQHPDVYYAVDGLELSAFLDKLILAGDIIITMGAGNVFHYHEAILDILKNR